MNPADVAGEALTALGRYLPDIADPELAAGCSAAARTLFGLVSRQLADRDEGEAMEEFVLHPENSSLVRRILAGAVGEDPALGAALADAVRGLAVGPGATTFVNQVGNVVGGHLAGRDQVITTDSSADHSRHTKIGGGFVAVGAVVAVLIGLCLLGRALLGGISGDALTADSTCAQFLEAPQEEQRLAINRIGLDRQVSSIGSPLALPAISYSCGARPEARLGDVVAEFRG